ncbi:MAG: HDOD domain-containing protein [Treponema sp.]|jgi:HD-like signal output (HDOD) protein|nr:HDOD domain-containing protein [Treponema sp.]
MDENSELIGEKLSRYVRSMPSLPITALKTIALSNDPRANPAEIRQLVSLDPVLVGKLLRFINSAYFGLPRSITSVAQAIIMLGLNTVKNLAILTPFPTQGLVGGLDMEQFWLHSFCVGAASKIIARRRMLPAHSLEEYFIAGLFHDIGKVALHAVFGETGVPGMDHCRAGSVIIREWKLEGSALGDAVTYHHTYPGYTGPHADVLFNTVAANRCAAFMGIECEPYPGTVDPLVWERLKVQENLFDEIKSEIDAEIMKAESFLRV